MWQSSQKRVYEINGLKKHPVSVLGKKRLPYFEEIEGYDMDVIKNEYLNSQILQKMLVDFRNIR